VRAGAPAGLRLPLSDLISLTNSAAGENLRPQAAFVDETPVLVVSMVHSDAATGCEEEE